MSSTRGRKEAAEGSAEDQLNKKVSSVYTKGYFVVYPYGNREKDEFEEQPFADALLEEEAEWDDVFYRVPTFEQWCQALCYDTDKDDGGEYYQTLKSYVLVKGFSNSEEKDGLSTIEHREFPTEVDDPEEIDGEHVFAVAETTKYLNVNRSKYPVLARGMTKNSRPKGFNKKGELVLSTWDYQTPEDDSLNYMQTAAGTDFPQGQVHLLQTLGVSKKMGVCRQGNENEYQTAFVKRDAALKNKKALSGCVDFMTRFAVFYGLYDYPHEKVEWCEERVYGGKTFKVRHRMPNPQYSAHLRSDGRYELYVQEPLIQETGAQEFVGGEWKKGTQSTDPIKGVEVPKWEMRTTIEPLAGYMGEERGKDMGKQQEVGPHIVTYLVGWFGNPEIDGDMSGGLIKAKKPSPGMRMSVNAWHEYFKGSPFAGRMHYDEEGNTMFGWGMTKAVALCQGLGDARKSFKRNCTWKTKTVLASYGGSFYQRQFELENPSEPMKKFRGKKIESFVDRKYEVLPNTSGPFVELLKAPFPDLNKKIDWVLLGKGVEKHSDLYRALSKHTVEVETPRRRRPAPAPFVGGVLEREGEGEEEEPELAVLGPTQTTKAKSYARDDTVEENLYYAAHAVVDISTENANNDAKRDQLERLPNRDTHEGVAKEKELTKEVVVSEAFDGMERAHKDDNLHYKDDRWQPWSAKELYQHNYFRIDRYLTPMTDDVEEHRKVNKYLNASVPSVIDEGELRKVQVFGAPFTVRMWYEQQQLPTPKGKDTRLLDLPLGANNLPKELQEVFDKNKQIIVNLYFNQERLGILKNHKKEVDAWSKPLKVGVKGKDTTFPPVFTKAPQKKDFPALSKRLATDRQLTVSAAEAKRVNGLAWNKAFTVLHWVCSSHHLERLPLRELSSNFGENEAFCAGCVRCSRPFFEFKHNYAALVTEDASSAALVHRYFRDDTLPANHAPKPFHCAEFWLEEDVMPNGLNAPREDTVEAIDGGEVREVGFHNWPTKEFLVGKTQLRSKKSGKLYDDFLKLGKPLVYRQYMNPVYAVMLDLQYKETTSGCVGIGDVLPYQGVVRSSNAMVAWGMKDVFLQRMNKYSNVCRDCANTLTVTGQLKRPGRMSGEPPRKGRGAPDTYWLQMRKLTVDVNGVTHPFNPLFVYMNMPRGPPKDANWSVRYSKAGESIPLKQRTPSLFKSLTKRQKEVAVTTLDVDKRAFGKRDRLPKFTQTQQLAEVFKPPDDVDDKEAYIDAFTEAHFKAAEEYSRSRNACAGMGVDKPTKVVAQELYIQKSFDAEMAMAGTLQEQDTKIYEEGKGALETIRKALDDLFYGRPAASPLHTELQKLCPKFKGNRVVRDALSDTTEALIKNFEGRPIDESARNTVYDPDMLREERRNVRVTLDAKVTIEAPNDDPPLVLNDKVTWKDKSVWDRCLYISQLQEPYAKVTRQNAESYKETAMKKDNLAFYRRIYLYDTKKGDGGILVHTKDGWVKTRHGHQWEGDDYLDSAKDQYKQVRQFEQTRVFVTYSFHRRVNGDQEARRILETMADGLQEVFANDNNVARLLVYGYKLVDMQGDTVGRKQWQLITESKKEEKAFYGNRNRSSYESDTYSTHVELVKSDSACEIGPNHHYPHFHTLLTLNHYTKLQVDSLKLRSLLEQIWKGKYPTQSGDDPFRTDLELVDGAGFPYYGPNEMPYINIKKTSTEAFDKVIVGYLRKSATGNIMEAIAKRVNF